MTRLRPRLAQNDDADWCSSAQADRKNEPSRKRRKSTAAENATKEVTKESATEEKTDDEDQNQNNRLVRNMTPKRHEKKKEADRISQRKARAKIKQEIESYKYTIEKLEKENRVLRESSAGGDATQALIDLHNMYHRVVEGLRKVIADLSAKLAGIDIPKPNTESGRGDTSKRAPHGPSSSARKKNNAKSTSPSAVEVGTSSISGANAAGNHQVIHEALPQYDVPHAHARGPLALNFECGHVYVPEQGNVPQPPGLYHATQQPLSQELVDDGYQEPSPSFLDGMVQPISQNSMLYSPPPVPSNNMSNWHHGMYCRGINESSPGYAESYFGSVNPRSVMKTQNTPTAPYVIKSPSIITWYTERQDRDISEYPTSGMQDAEQNDDDENAFKLESSRHAIDKRR